MNEVTRIRAPHATTQAADGLPRLKWTLIEFEKLSELGFFGGIDGERERVELVDGEIVPMHAKGSRHEWVRGELQNALSERLPRGHRLYTEPGWRPGGERYFEPEIIICKAGFQASQVPASEVLLLVEVSDTSLKYDEGTKARIYSILGVREYWVVDAKSLSTLVHCDPSPEGYRSQSKVPKSKTLTPALLPELSISMGSLGVE